MSSGRQVDVEEIALKQLEVVATRSMDRLSRLENSNFVVESFVAIDLGAFGSTPGLQQSPQSLLRLDGGFVPRRRQLDARGSFDGTGRQLQNRLSHQLSRSRPQIEKMHRTFGLSLLPLLLPPPQMLLVSWIIKQSHGTEKLPCSQRCDFSVRGGSLRSSHRSRFAEVVALEYVEITSVNPLLLLIVDDPLVGRLDFVAGIGILPAFFQNFVNLDPVLEFFHRTGKRGYHGDPPLDQVRRAQQYRTDNLRDPKTRRISE
mmetsp:Transcript_22298/g.53031  ORF Transcript_22298/g.53031 Transcript_22298/m.53031 type:complete len:259 (+) Transcript_22298:613-1389(+)